MRCSVRSRDAQPGFRQRKSKAFKAEPVNLPGRYTVTLSPCANVGRAKARISKSDFMFFPYRQGNQNWQLAYHMPLVINLPTQLYRLLRVEV
jgi:hypothetical protein